MVVPTASHSACGSEGDSSRLDLGRCVLASFLSQRVYPPAPGSLVTVPVLKKPLGVSCCLPVVLMKSLGQPVTPTPSRNLTLGQSDPQIGAMTYARPCGT